jgi:hypothetical protein
MKGQPKRAVPRALGDLGHTSVADPAAALDPEIIRPEQGGVAGDDSVGADEGDVEQALAQILRGRVAIDHL